MTKEVQRIYDEIRRRKTELPNVEDQEMKSVYGAVAYELDRLLDFVGSMPDRTVIPIWHSANEKPVDGTWICVRRIGCQSIRTYYYEDNKVNGTSFNENFKDFVYEWAYPKDLLNVQDPEVFNKEVLAKECDNIADELWDEVFVDGNPITPRDFREIVFDVASHFVKRKFVREEDNETDNDLEDEIKKHIQDCLDVKFPTTDIESIKKDVEYTARHFAEWQRKRDIGNLLKSDYTVFNKCYEEGKKDQKKEDSEKFIDCCREMCGGVFDFAKEFQKVEMIDNGIDCTVEWCDGPYLNFTTGQLNDALDKAGIKIGDKVKVAIVKEDE